MTLKEYLRDLENIKEDVQRVEEVREKLRMKEEDIQVEKNSFLEEIEYYELGDTVTEEELRELREIVENNNFQKAEQRLKQMLTR